MAAVGSSRSTSSRSIGPEVSGWTRARARSSISSKRSRKVMSSQWSEPAPVMEWCWAARGAGAGQLDVATQPLLVGHLGDVAEVGLAGVGHRLDQLVLAGERGLEVTRDLVEDAAGARGAVVDLVDVRTELAAAGGDVALAAARADPADLAVHGRDAGGVDEELLHGRGGGRLLGGHRGGADEHAVDGHRRLAVQGRPRTGEVVDCAVRRTDPATDADDEVVDGAQVGVRREQELVEVLPRVVPAGDAALDVHDDGGVDLTGDREHHADLLDGAGLEHDVRDAGLVQVLDDVDGVLELGDAGADHQAVEGSPGEARLLQQSLAADVQLPEVGVEQERVELRRAALVEELGQLGHVLVEDPLGDLAAAGELGPVAGVRGRGDDLGVDGGRGHPGEQDRRLAGEPGERRVHDGLAVAAVDQLRGVRRPVGGRGHGGTGGEEQVATSRGCGRDDRDATTAQRAAGHVRGELGGTEVDDPAGLRADGVGELARPVDGLHADGVGEVLGQTGVETAGLGPVAGHGDGRGERGVVEAERDGHRLDGRAERPSAADLGLDLGGLGGAALVDGGAEAAKDGRGAADHEAARTVDGAHGRGLGGVAGRRPRRRAPRDRRGWRR